MEKEYLLGLDLGGTNAVFGIVDRRGSVVATTAIKTQAYQRVEEFVEASVKAINQLAEQVGGVSEIEAMGIGAPAANYYTGTMENAANIVWAHGTVVPLADMFSQQLSIPVKMTNDANTVAMGEMMYGAARGMKNFVVLTLGTGVGSGIVINGQVVYGSDGFAGELGHVPVFHGGKGRPCGCGNKGCLETYCSATGVAQTAREFLKDSDEPSSLRNMEPEKITSLDVFLAAKEGDALAKRIFDYTGEILGMMCAEFTAYCTPEAFIFFGGLANAGELLMEPIRKSYAEHVLPVLGGKAKFMTSGLDSGTAAILGAAAVSLG